MCCVYVWCSPSSFYWQNQTRVILRAEVTNRRIEVATLFDATKTIVVRPHT